MTIPDSAFRLKWRETWPGESREDYTVREGHKYLRLYRHTTGGSQSGRWRWFSSSSRTGFGDTAREAALDAEKDWFGER